MSALPASRCERCRETHAEVCDADAIGASLCPSCYEDLNDIADRHGLHDVDVETVERETRDEGRGLPPGGPSALVPRPSSIVSSPDRDTSPNFTNGRGPGSVEGPEVEWLLTEHAAGRLEPVPVGLPQLPPSRSPVVPRVADFYRLVRGLRLRVDDDRPVPFACGWVADKLGVPKLTVRRARSALVEAGVLVSNGSLPGRGGRGTELFEPGPVACGMTPQATASNGSVRR